VRVGIDFGKTIGLLEEEPAPFAFEMILHLAHKFGSENVFIVSKAGERIEERIRQWLEDHAFYEATGFAHENVIFVRGYADKAIVVERLRISIFFDDKCKIVASLAPLPVIDRIFWMHASSEDVVRRIPKNLRYKVVPTREWSSTMKFFQKIPRRAES